MNPGASAAPPAREQGGLRTERVSTPQGEPLIPRTAQPPAPRAEPPRKFRFSPSHRFWICTGVLALFGGGLPLLGHVFDWHFAKDAVPLKKPLMLFDTRQLLPRYSMHRIQPAPIPDETLESLGTREYFQATLVDETKRPEDRTRCAHVIVTYYTGNPDQVPHVPEECVQAAGYTLLDGRTFDVPAAGVGAPGGAVPIRMLRFDTRRRSHTAFVAGESPELNIAYFFHASDAYATTRNEVRLRQANPFQRYAYYAKIEIHFTDEAPFARNASREETVAALGPLVERLMSILLGEHFAWKEALAADAQRKLESGATQTAPPGRKP